MSTDMNDERSETSPRTNGIRDYEKTNEPTVISDETLGITLEDIDAVAERLSWHDDDVVVEGLVDGQWYPILTRSFWSDECSVWINVSLMALRKFKLRQHGALIGEVQTVRVCKPFMSSDGIMFSVKK